MKEELNIMTPDQRIAMVSQEIYFHKHWLDRIKRSVKGVTYISHVHRPSAGTYHMKVIRDGVETLYPLEGHPSKMVSENYEDFLKELNEA